MARASLRIDLGAVARNWRALDAMTSVETAAVVKGDAYGLGIGPVAKALQGAGATTFFVALAEEGAALRDTIGVGPDIFVFSGLMGGDVSLVREAGLIPLLNSPDQVARHLSDLPGHPCGLQIDTGMNRLGLEAAELMEIALHLPSLAPRLIISHLASADAPADPANAAQLATFHAMTTLLSVYPRSLAATGGMLLRAAYHFDMTRPGVGLYGGLPFADAEPVVQLDLPVIQVRDLLPGEGVGYGLSWRATRPSRIATLAAGYADGLLRAGGAGKIMVYAGDTPAPVVGRISMDLITVDVTELKAVPPALSILNRHQRIDDLARQAGTIGYEILTSLGARYAREYIGGTEQ